MVTRRFHFLAVLLGFAAAHCGPPRGFDTDVRDVASGEGGGPDVQDVQQDRPIPADARDASMDAAMDSGEGGMGCDPMLCDSTCMMVGAPGGACREGRCTCIGVTMDSGGRDGTTGVDAPVFESSIIRCVLNSDCPPSTFCQGTACTGMGFCSPRGDMASCGTEVMPSCGCDGRIYMNTCVRLVAGVRLAPSTMCSSDGGGADTGTRD